MAISKGQIGNALESTADNRTVATADAIYDDTYSSDIPEGKLYDAELDPNYLNNINKDLKNKINSIKDDVYTKEQSDAKFSTLESLEEVMFNVNQSLDNYYKKTETYNKEEVDTLGNQLKNIAEARLPIDSFNQWSETVPTKTQLDDLQTNVINLLSNVYTKSESDSKYLTEHQDISGKVDKVIGKLLSTEDFTTILKTKLEELTNYDDSVLSAKIDDLKSRLDTLVGGNDATAVIDTFQEIEAFLQGITNKETLTGLLQEMQSDIISLIPNGEDLIPIYTLDATNKGTGSYYIFYYDDTKAIEILNKLKEAPLLYKLILIDEVETRNFFFINDKCYDSINEGKVQTIDIRETLLGGRDGVDVIILEIITSDIFENTKEEITKMVSDNYVNLSSSLIISGEKTFKEAVIAKSFIKEEGTSSQVLLADGSVKDIDYNVGDEKTPIYFDNGVPKPCNLMYNILLEDLLAYGVEWKDNVADPHLTRIGNMSLHKSLPIQSLLKGCIAQVDKVIYWLAEDDWRFRKDPIYMDVDLSNDIEFPNFGEASIANLAVGQFVKADTHIGKITFIEGTNVTVEWEEDLADISVELVDITKLEIGSRLDGYDGTVRVHCPSFYIKSEIIENTRRVWVSTIKIDNTWTYQPEILIDAYRSTVLNTVPENMGYLSTLPVNSAVSIVNNSDYCRGGNNSNAYDQYLASNIFRTQLNKPRTNISRSTMRTYSRNGGNEMMNYNQYKNIFYWLYVIEYANFNCLEAYNSDLTVEGYKQGGLGNGVTTINTEWWESYNGYYPITPCGYCNEFGNNSGIRQAILPSITTKSNSTTNINNYTKVTYTEIVNDIETSKNIWTYTMSDNVMTITKVNKDTSALQASRKTQSGFTVYKIEGLLSEQSIIFYKGNTIIETVSENGEITIDWGNDSTTRLIRSSFVGDCNIQLSIVSSSLIEYTLNGTTVQVPRWRGFDNPFGDIWTNLEGIIIQGNEPDYNTASVYVTDNPENYGDNLDAMNKMYLAGKEIKQDGWIKTFDLGTKAEIIPNIIGGSSTTYKCDYHLQGTKNNSLRTVLVGGSANHGSSSGLGCFNSNNGVSHAWTNIGFRSVSLSSSSFSSD